MALTKMKRAFIASYCDDPKLGQAEAARKAGASIKRAKITAYEWMRDPEVKLEIQRQLSKSIGRIENQTGKRELTPESVIQDLDDIAEICKLAGAGAWQVSTLVKIAELKGKYLKMFTDRVELGLDDKLIGLLEAGRKRSGLAQLTEGGAPIIEGSVNTEESQAEESADEPKKESIQ